MLNNSCNLRGILFEFLSSEYGINYTFEELLESFLEDINRNIFPIAESSFGDNIDFYGKTVLNIADLTLENEVVNCVTEKDLLIQHSFKNVEDLKEYLYKSSFDELLLIDLDEEILEKITC
ncbi:hypothetical protein [Staphylococcus hominis]|uniref:hypothetical protein n=1 Tax=Staphylococcus hominis TaxID=1290 RepID=UPI001F59C954|nr:hypothetical protein [Staphylococcus hominis]MCI2910908.1 hypothetical protein [Staphylococcus hominis]